MESLLPDSLTVDTFDGSAWVGLVPFVMQGVRPWWSPAVPGISNMTKIGIDVAKLVCSPMSSARLNSRVSFVLSWRMNLYSPTRIDWAGTPVLWHTGKEPLSLPKSSIVYRSIVPVRKSSPGPSFPATSNAGSAARWLAVWR